MGFSLRDYQQKAHDACREAFSAGYRRLLLVAPPRSGKGTIIAYQAVEAAKKGAQVLIWVHKNELVYEIQKRLKEQMGVDCGLIIAGEPIRKSKRIQVMSVMTGIRRDLSWLNPHLIITDETHRILSTSQKEGLLAQWPGVRLIGYTATPFRNDKRFMSEVFDKLIQITTWAEQEERGVLVPAVVYAPKGAASLDGIKLRMSSDGMDYDKKEMSRRFSEDKVLEALYQKWVQYTRGKLQTMCFNVDKANNKAVCDYFKAKGVSAVSVDESTPKAQRAAILKKFYEGPFAKEPIMFLCNIALFCLDSKTEILTSDGWVGMEDMTEEHKVANWVEDGSIFFEEPKEVYRRPRQPDEKMISVESARMNIRVTGNHKMLYKNVRGTEWRKFRADEVANKDGLLPVCGHAEPLPQVMPKTEVTSKRVYLNKMSYHFRLTKGVGFEESREMAEVSYVRHLETKKVKRIDELTLAECRFIGFWIGDGSVQNLKRHGKEFILCQSSVYPFIIEWLEKVISDCGFDSIKRDKMNTSGNMYHTWSIGTGRGHGHQQREGVHQIMPYLNKSGFNEMFSMNQEQFDALVEGFWMADGNHYDGRNMPNTITISNTNTKLLDIMQAVACCRGYSCSIKKNWTKLKENHNQVYLIRMTKGLNHVCMTKARSWMYLKEEEGYKEEEVWCVRTTSGNIITRRNGKVVVTGNSEGIDCPTVKCVILNYATKSFAKLIQSAARGSGALYGPDKEWLKLEDGRPYKKNVIIIDMGSNFQRHECTLETYDAFGFSLDGVVKKGEAPTRVCPECDLTVHISKKECPGCGYVFPPSLMKEEKKLASEVEFGSLKTDQLLALKIMNTLPSDEHVRVACPTHWLRLTAVVNGKGDPTLYAHQMLLKREHEKIKADFGLRKIEHVAQLLDISTPGNKRRFTQRLDELEKRKATHSTYLRISGNVLGV